MRADRLVSLVLLLRRRGRLTADTVAWELEVSTRTVLRDIEALSAAGVPVYAERGRHGGFALSPGFRTELNHDEAVALLTAGSARGEQVFGLGSALTSAMRKVVDALPEKTIEPVPTPEVLWRKPPVLAITALPGTTLGRLGGPSTGSSAAWAAAGAAIRKLHDAPLPPRPGPAGASSRWRQNSTTSASCS